MGEAEDWFKGFIQNLEVGDYKVTVQEEDGKKSLLWWPNLEDGKDQPTSGKVSYYDFEAGCWVTTVYKPDGTTEEFVKDFIAEGLGLVDPNNWLDDIEEEVKEAYQSGQLDTWDGPQGQHHQIHGPRQCEGENCVFHNPSEHIMSEWPIHLRFDKGGLVERICYHGIGHPDPDSLDYYERNGADYMAVHGCDSGCISGFNMEGESCHPKDHLEDKNG